VVTFYATEKRSSPLRLNGFQKQKYNSVMGVPRIIRVLLL